MRAAYGYGGYGTPRALLGYYSSTHSFGEGGRRLLEAGWVGSEGEQAPFEGQRRRVLGYAAYGGYGRRLAGYYGYHA